MERWRWGPSGTGARRTKLRRACKAGHCLSGRHSVERWKASDAIGVLIYTLPLLCPQRHHTCYSSQGFFMEGALGLSRPEVPSSPSPTNHPEQRLMIHIATQCTSIHSTWRIPHRQPAATPANTQQTACEWRRCYLATSCSEQIPVEQGLGLVARHTCCCAPHTRGVATRSEAFWLPCCAG